MTKRIESEADAINRLSRFFLISLVGLSALSLAGLVLQRLLG